ncbi:MAG TPA: dihydrolipoamide acetyltransferase family protein, partial [Anaerolineaceae bacterium]
VKAGQAIIEVETDKAVNEVESPGSGILARIVKQEGETVPCNGVLAVILEPGEVLPARIPEMIAEGVTPKAEVSVKVEGADGPAAPAAAAAAEPVRIPISPSAKALAQELGVDIASIVPRGNRIMREDVEAAYQAKQAKQVKPPAAPKVTRQEMSTTRRRIAEHMSRSSQSVARVGLSLEADASGLIAWRESLSSGGKKISYNVLLASLAARALKEFPYMNAQIDGDAIVTYGEVNIGIAVDAERGLLVPVLRQADQKDPAGLQAEFDELSQRALEGRSKLEDLQGGTFTITNLGSLEIESFLPVVNSPECAILGVGAIVKKTVVVDEMIAIRPRMNLTLAFDHRLVDGAPAGRFLQRIKHLVENPAG